jgi:hypothetical protein
VFAINSLYYIFEKNRKLVFSAIQDNITIFILQFVKNHMKTLVWILLSIITLISTAPMAIAQNTTTNTTGGSGGMSSESVEMAQ